ncbi:hypothetical protein HK100_004544 [Physocladia obscura]|uniref:Peroxidase n=1 Tax=Physocladia obscura TaxID=109957 RepID=A0AAD5STQ0_9FUNG|nr:hypothetical protein HK100_004544 [Physocladia obscura]
MVIETSSHDHIVAFPDENQPLLQNNNNNNVISSFLPSASNDSVFFSAVEQDIRAILKRPGFDNGNIGPILVRLAWHCAGTFDVNGCPAGGSDGATMRFFPEVVDPANNGLEVARNLLEPIKQKHGDKISYADLWTFSGVVVIHALGGPRVAWKPGRIDLFPPTSPPPNNSHCQKVPQNGRLPDASRDAAHLRGVFRRMGFSDDRAIVALAGAHCLGMCHMDHTGYDGVWTHTPNVFNNHFFVNLLDKTWHKRDWDGDWTGPVQYDDEDEQIMMLPTDMALLWDDAFRSIVEEYKDDQDLFFRDFSDAFARLLELGVARSNDGGANGGQEVLICDQCGDEETRIGNRFWCLEKNEIKNFGKDRGRNNTLTTRTVLLLKITVLTLFDPCDAQLCTDIDTTGFFRSRK